MKRETVEAMAANIARMLSNVGKLAKMAADEIEGTPPHFVRGHEERPSEFAARVAQRRKNRAALVSALRTMQNNFTKETE